MVCKVIRPLRACRIGRFYLRNAWHARTQLNREGICRRSFLCATIAILRLMMFLCRYYFFSTISFQNTCEGVREKEALRFPHSANSIYEWREISTMPLWAPRKRKWSIAMVQPLYISLLRKLIGGKLWTLRRSIRSRFEPGSAPLVLQTRHLPGRCGAVFRFMRYEIAGKERMIFSHPLPLTLRSALGLPSSGARMASIFFIISLSGIGSSHNSVRRTASSSCCGERCRPRSCQSHNGCKLERNCDTW